MAEARERHDWDHTATLVAYVLNANLGPHKKPYQPKKFHPYYRDDERDERLARAIPGDISCLKIFDKSKG